MSTITTILSTDAIKDSRAVINTNFSNLNTDKMEKSGGTFTGDIIVPEEVYGAGWNASLEAPTKNSVYDKIETLATGAASSTDNAIARFDSPTGKIIQNSGVIIDDSNNITGVTTLDIGNADTTLSRSAAGVLAVEGVVIPTISSTNTLTNKRVTKRTGTTTSSATPTINTDNVDYYSLTAQTVDITSFTTNLSGTPTEGQLLWISITGTAARAITWGASFEASTIALPTTTVTTNRLDVGFVWNTVTNKWRCIAVS